MRLTRSGSLKLVMMAIMLLWASTIATPAKAASVTFAFEGAVNNVGSNLTSNPTSLLGIQNGSLNPSMTLSGSFTFTPGTGSVTTLATNLSQYSDTISNLHFTLKQGPTGNELVNYSNTGMPNTTNTITVGHDVTSVTQVASDMGLEVLTTQPSDTYTVVIPFMGLPPITGGPTASQLEIYYWHPNALGLPPVSIPSEFNDSSLPTTPPGITINTPVSFRVVFTGGNQSTVTGTIHSLSLVATPLPPAVILFGAGLVSLIGLGARNWRQRKDGLVTGPKN